MWGPSMGKTKSHGRKVRPLNREQIEAFNTAAREIEDDLAALSAQTLLYTGLRVGEFCHLRRAWIEKNPPTKIPLVHIPSKDRCLAEQNKNDSSCDHGQNSSDELWAPKSGASIRSSPILRESAADLILDWFYNHRQVPLHHGQVKGHVKRVANEAEIEREILPLDLRNTYGAILASKGMNQHVIGSAMGLNQRQSAVHLIKFADDEIEAPVDKKWDSVFSSEADDDSTESNNDE